MRGVIRFNILAEVYSPSPLFLLNISVYANSCRTCKSLEFVNFYIDVYKISLNEPTFLLQYGCLSTKNLY